MSTVSCKQEDEKQVVTPGAVAGPVQRRRVKLETGLTGFSDLDEVMGVQLGAPAWVFSST